MDLYICKKLKIIRKEKQYSQSQIADLLNISVSAYSRIECGDSFNWVRYIAKLSDFYNIELEYFLSTEMEIECYKQKKKEKKTLEKIIKQQEENLREKESYIKNLEFLLKKSKQKIA